MELEEWVERYRRAWEAADPDAVVELFTENASYRSNIFREPHVGRAAIRAYWERATGTQADIEVRMGHPFTEGNRVIVEWWTTMRDDEGEITLPGCLILRFSAQGLCEDLREYWQTSEGRQDPPAGWGE